MKESESEQKMKKMKSLFSAKSIEGQLIEEANGDSLRVFPSVNKYEVINFLIAYLRCIEPTIH